MKEKITVTISDGGKTQVSVEGHAGAGCQKLTEELERALGSVAADTKTPEFFHRAAQGQQAKAGH